MQMTIQAGAMECNRVTILPEESKAIEKPERAFDDPKKLIVPIMEAVADYYGLKVDDLKTKSREKHIVWPRQVAMFLSWDLTHVPYSQIGKAFGGKNHTTIIHNQKAVQDQLDVNPKAKKEFEFVKNFVIERCGQPSDRKA